MTATTLINLLGIVAVGAAVGWAWTQATRARWLLADYLEILQGAIGSSNVDESLTALAARTRAYLAQRGMRGLGTPERSLLIEVTRARAEAARAEITSRIELMPQFGLLGTVVGLTLSMLAQPETVFDGLGLALLTTLVGLLAAAIAKARIEPDADNLLQLVLALSEDRTLRARVEEHRAAHEIEDAA